MGHTIGTKRFNYHQILVLEYIDGIFRDNKNDFDADDIIEYLKSKGVNKSREGFIDLIQRVIRRLMDDGVGIEKISETGRGRKLKFRFIRISE